MIEPTRILGIENEFKLIENERQRNSADYIKKLIKFIKKPYCRKTETSFRLHTGGGVYCDGLELEITTPPIKVKKGCIEHLVSSLVTQKKIMLDSIKQYNKKQPKHKKISLTGYSSHYNFSYDGDYDIKRFREELTDSMGIPYYALIENGLSSGIMFRNKGGRLEICGEYIVNPLQVEAAMAFMLGTMNGLKKLKSCEPQKKLKDILPFSTFFSKSSRNMEDVIYSEKVPNLLREGSMAKFAIKSGDKIIMMSAMEMLKEYYSIFRDDIKSVVSDHSPMPLEAFINGDVPLEIDLSIIPDGYKKISHTPYKRYKPKDYAKGLSLAASMHKTKNNGFSIRLQNMNWEDVTFILRKNKRSMDATVHAENIPAFNELLSRDAGRLVKWIEDGSYCDYRMNLKLDIYRKEDDIQKKIIKELEDAVERYLLDFLKIMDDNEIMEHLPETVLEDIIIKNISKKCINDASERYSWFKDLKAHLDNTNSAEKVIKNIIDLMILKAKEENDYKVLIGIIKDDKILSEVIPLDKKKIIVNKELENQLGFYVSQKMDNQLDFNPDYAYSFIENENFNCLITPESDILPGLKPHPNG